MVSDLIAYGLLASVFILNGLRMFVKKPGSTLGLPLRRGLLRIRPTESKQVSTGD